MKIKFSLSLFIFAAIYASQVYAEYRDFSAGLGNLTYFVGDIQVNEEGGTNSVDFNPYLTVYYDYSLNEHWSVLPELGVTFPRKAESDNVKKINIFGRTDIGYHHDDWNLMYRFGIGLFFYRVWGDGGNQVLRNGTGETTFYLPQNTRSSVNLTLDLGLEYFFSEKISLKAQGHVFAITSSLKRQYTYTLSAYYHFGDIELDF